MYRTYPNSLKENRRMSTCNRLDLQTIGSQQLMLRNLPDHWFWHMIHLLKLLATMCHCYHAGATIDILNQCTQDLTACRTDQDDTSTTCYVLSASGGRQSVDVGATWTGGLFWAFPASSGTDSATGTAAKPQANVAEININGNGQDSYDISNVVSTSAQQVLEHSRSRS